MEILFIGKIPPIEGGESASGLEYVLSLARQGHTIHLVTNANEVEHNFRSIFLDEDFHFFEHLIEDRIIIHNTTSIKGYFHIPFSDAYFSKLFGIGTAIIESENIERIVGWYFEPYCLVAAILGKLHNIQTGIFHAGSDLTRLSNHPDLYKAYKWMVNNATEIFTKPSSINTLSEKFDIDKNKLRVDSNGGLPSYFHKDNRFDFQKYVGLSERHFEKVLKSERQLLRDVLQLNQKPIGEENVTIGIYGKVSPNKGNVELLDALEKLSSDGYKFNFVTISSGTLRNVIHYYKKIVNSTSLRNNTWILPFIPPWRIPGFIKFCDVICFLENNFPIKIHRPQIPFEVLSQGTCLFLSKDILDNLPYKKLLINHKNFICIEKVLEVELRDKLKFAIEHKSIIRTIGGHGKSVVYFLENHP